MTLDDAALPDLLATARDWAVNDPDPATAAQLRELIEAATSENALARMELAAAMSSRSWAAVAGSGSLAAQSRAVARRSVSAASSRVMRLI